MKQKGGFLRILVHSFIHLHPVLMLGKFFDSKGSGIGWNLCVLWLIIESLSGRILLWLFLGAIARFDKSQKRTDFDRRPLKSPVL